MGSHNAIMKRFLSLVFIFSAFPLYSSSLKSLDQILLKDSCSAQMIPAAQLSLDFKASSNTSAGCFNYTLHEHEVYVLLGLRNDENTWCTTGGHSKEGEDTLAETASHECAEESFNVYCPHPDSLRLKPFIDLITLPDTPSSKDSVLFRLYFNEVEYCDASVFNTYLSNAQDLNLTSEYREFREFRWVLARHLLKAIDSETPHLQESQEITLYKPLYEILRTPTAREFLSRLSQQRSLHFTTQEEAGGRSRTQRNRLYVRPLNIEHGISKGKEKRTLSEENAPEGEETPRDQDQDNDLIHNSHHRKAFGHAVVAKALAGLELKERFREKGLGLNEDLKEEEPYPSPDLWSPRETLSDLLLKHQLGEDYISPRDPADPEECQKSDRVNLQTYAQRSSLKDKELKRPINPLESDFKRLSEIMVLERQKKGWIPMFHAATSEVGFFACLASSLRQALTLRLFPEGTTPSLRATDIYFKDRDTMADSLNQAGFRDYENGNADCRLSANMAITSGFGMTHSSSSSIEYFVHSHSVDAPSSLEKFEESLHFLGLTNASFLPYQALFQQFHNNLGGGFPQSTFFLLLLNPDILERYAYAAIGGGTPHTFTHQEETFKPTALEAYQGGSEELRTALGASSQPPFEKLHYMAEMRLLLHPDIMHDPTKVQVYPFHRFPLPLEKQKAFQARLRETLIYDLGSWLSHHTMLMPDSLRTPCPLKRLYAYAYQGMTGQKVIESPVPEAFNHLIKRGHFEGAKHYFQAYPDLVKNLNISPRSLVIKAIHSQNKDMVQFVIEEVLQTTVGHCLSETDIVSLLTHQPENLDYLFYLLEDFNVDFIPEEYRKEMAFLTLQSTNLKSFELAHRLYPLTPEFIKEVLQTSHFLNSSLLETPLIAKIDLAELCSEIILDDLSSEPIHAQAFIETLVLEKNMAHERMPESGNPVLFSVAHFPSMTPEMYDFIKANPSLVDLKNREGLTFYQYIQKSFLEGKFVQVGLANTLNILLYKKGRHYQTEAYAPYIEEFGNNNLKTDPFPPMYANVSFADPQFLAWRQSLQDALDSDRLSRVINVLESAPEENYRRLYKSKNPIDQGECLRRLLLPGSKNDVWSLENPWKKRLESVLEQDRYRALTHFIRDAILETSYWQHIKKDLKTVCPNTDALNQKARRRTPYVEVKDALTHNPQEFIALAQKGDVTPHLKDLAFWYFDDSKIDLVKETLPYIYPDPEEFLEGCKSFYLFLSSEINAVIARYIGLETFLKKVPEKGLTYFFDNISPDLMQEIETTCSHMILYRDDERDLFPYFCHLDSFQNIDFITKHLDRFKATYARKSLVPLIFHHIFNEALWHKIVRLDPSVLSLKMKYGVPMKDFLVVRLGEDSLCYKTFIALEKKYGIG